MEKLPAIPCHRCGEPYSSYGHKCRIALDEPADASSAGKEREILVTIYIYDHDSDAVNVDLGHVMSDMNCSIFATCELVQRFFTISTDAYARDSACVDRFITALKASGVNIGKHEWSTLPSANG